MKLPKLSFGGLQLGGHGIGVVDESEIIRSAHKAIDYGIQIFDTAPIYGLGNSEELLGRILTDKRDQVTIIDRIGLRWFTPYRKVIDNSPKHIKRQVESSLKRIGIDCIDICLLHYHDINVPIDETMNCLLKLKSQGKIGGIGCSNTTYRLFDEYVKLYDGLFAECRFNLIYRESEYQLYPFFGLYETPIIACTPLAEGLLTGKYDEHSKFDTQDRRGRPDNRYFGSKYINQNMRILDRVKAIASKYGCEPSQVALKWVMQNESISIVSIGIKTVDQLESNLKAIKLELSYSDMMYLEFGESE